MSLLGDTGIKPYNEQELTANRIQFGNTQNQTNLLALADLQRQQASEQEYLRAIQTNPALAQQFFGGSVLGSIGPTGGPPAPAGGGPMTQQTVLPGQPPGAPQVVPGGQDLSQFATQGAPQSTIASLGPQPQGPPNPVLEMARRDPRAAFMLQQRMQQQQDMQVKAQEQQFKMRATVAEGIAVELQGATDQASYDAARQRVAQISPQWAQALPQVYSKEAVQPYIDRALGVKDRMTLQTNAVAAQAELMRARMSGRVAKTDQYLKALGVAPGQETAEDMQKALAWQQRDEMAVSASQGTGQIVKGPTGEYIRVKPGTNEVEVIRGPGGEPLREKPSETEQKGATLANSVAAANKLATELEDKGYKPNVWDKGMDMVPFGLGNYLTSSDHQKYRQTVREFASAWLYGVSGAQITDSEWENANQTFFPQPNEDKGAVELKRQRRAALVEELRQQTRATGRTGAQGQPASQGALKPVGEMSREELLAERDRLRKGGR